MRKLICTVIASVAILGILALLSYQPHPSVTAAATVPTASAQLPVRNEAGDLIMACGAPREDAQRSATELGAGVTERTFQYAKVEFKFVQDANTGWTMTGAFPVERDETLSKQQVTRLMPCTAKVNFSNDLF